MYLRNKLEYRSVHGIMNTSGLLQVNMKPFGLKLRLVERFNMPSQSRAW